MHGIGQELLQSRVLRLKRFRLARLGDANATKLRFPFVKCRRVDPVPAAHLRRRNAPFLLPQNRNDLSSVNLNSFMSVMSVAFVTDSCIK